jgi:hypothetical protein
LNSISITVMELFEISVSYKNENHHFEVKDYMHHEGEQCKFEIYKQGVFVASFEPGSHKHLHICKDAGIEKEELLNLIADRIETYNI